MKEQIKLLREDAKILGILDNKFCSASELNYVANRLLATKYVARKMHYYDMLDAIHSNLLKVLADMKKKKEDKQILYLALDMLSARIYYILSEGIAECY